MEDIQKEIDSLSKQFKNQTDFPILIEQLETELKTNNALLETKEKKLKSLQQERIKLVHMMAHVVECS